MLRLSPILMFVFLFSSCAGDSAPKLDQNVNQDPGPAQSNGFPEPMVDKIKRSESAVTTASTKIGSKQSATIQEPQEDSPQSHDQAEDDGEVPSLLVTGSTSHLADFFADGKDSATIIAELVALDEDQWQAALETNKQHQLAERDTWNARKAERKQLQIADRRGRAARRAELASLDDAARAEKEAEYEAHMTARKEEWERLKSARVSRLESEKLIWESAKAQRDGKAPTIEPATLPEQMPAPESIF